MSIDCSQVAADQLTLYSDSPEQTEHLGYLLAGLLPGGTVIGLDGDLGAGKTALARGLAAGLGCLGPVASPTFTLVMEHPARPGGLAFYHFDVYRLESADDFLDLGLDEYFDRGGICMLEWAGRIAPALPPRTLQITLVQADSQHPDLRQITICWPGQSAWLHNLERIWSDADIGL